MARIKSATNEKDPATGRPLSAGVSYRGPHQYRVRPMLGGKRVTKTFETDSAARKWLAGKAAEVTTGTYVDRRSLDKSTMADLVRRFEAECMQDDGERRGASSDRGHIPSVLNDPLSSIVLAELQPSHIRGFRDRQLEAGYAKGTVVKRMNLLQSIIAHARSEWDVPLKENPATATAVKRPKNADKKRKRRLVGPTSPEIKDAVALGEPPPIDEEARILAALAGSKYPHDTLLFLWGTVQAMRQGESCAMIWSDIDLDRKLVEVHGRFRQGVKSADSAEELGPEIRLLMPGAVRILLGMIADTNPDPGELVFKVGGQNAFKTRFGRLLKKTGIKNFRYHDLRHEGTTRIVKRFKNAQDAMRVTGHRGIKSMDRYYHPDLSEMAHGAEEDDARFA
jgi:integrase